jgi:hypothetical protein
MRFIYLILIAILITSCGQSYIEESKVPQLENTFAKSYIDSLKNGSVNYCYNLIMPEHQNEQAMDYLKNVYNNLSTRKLINANVIGYRVAKMNDTKYTHLEYEYEHDIDWAYFTVDLINRGGIIKVQGFNGNGFQESLVKANNFSLKGKSFGHYLTLMLMIAIPLFILTTIVFIIITPIKRKVLWIIFALFGIFAIHFNWGTGDFMLLIRQLSPDGKMEMVKSAFLKISILGAGYTRPSVLHPWIMQFAIPVGAILFWIKRVKINKEKQIEETMNNVP